MALKNVAEKEHKVRTPPSTWSCQSARVRKRKKKSFDRALEAIYSPQCKGKVSITGSVIREEICSHRSTRKINPFLCDDCIQSPEVIAYYIRVHGWKTRYTSVSVSKKCSNNLQVNFNSCKWGSPDTHSVGGAPHN